MKEKKEKALAVSEENLKIAKEFLKRNKGQIIAKKKYFQTQKIHLEVEVLSLWKKKPHLPLTQVVVSIMKDLPDFLPPDNLVEVTRIITSFWQELNKEKVVI